MPTLRSYIDLNQVQNILYTTEFENGTGYFDGVFQQPSIETLPNISYFIDQYGRYALLLKANNDQGIVVHERYKDNEDLLVLTQSIGFNYSHSSTAINRLLELPLSEVLATLDSSDHLSFVTLLNEKCYFDY